MSFDENPKLPSFNSNIYSEHILSLSLSNISKSKFAEHYHFLCRFCNEVPVIKFVKRNKIKYECKCEIESPRILLIKDIFNYLLYSDKIDIDLSKLKCINHKDEKYIFYCKKCKKNICYKCFEDCIEHEKKIKAIAFDRKTINKSKYIIEKLEEQNKYDIYDDDINSDFLEEDNISNYKLLPQNHKTNFIEKISEYNNNNENNISNGDNYLIITKEENKIKNDINEEELLKTINDINKFENNKEEDYTSDLISIIVDDYKNYPNYNHIETISNLEKYISLSFDDYNEILLKYKFNKENIKYNSLELFGEVFVNKNKENCFLIINEKIMELDKYIKLSDIFDNSNNFIDWPIQLEVKLIEQKNKIMNNMSFMFYRINTLLPSSDFSKFNTINITKMNYMFYNCSSLTQIPDISNFNTENVTDMSFMFYNCSSLTQLPDISTSNFNTKNVTDMSYMFYNCFSLEKLPDISKWNMENVSNISNMFGNCESLVLIPDISNWNLRSVKNFDYLFKNCKSLSKLPKFSRIDLNKISSHFEMIEGCTLLEKKITKKKDYIYEIFNYFKIIIIRILSCLSVIFSIIFVLILFFLAYFPIYSSFNLVEVSHSSKYPLEYFNLKNYSNITFIAGCYNITNLTIIFEKFGNEENFINNKINFTLINKGIKFESELKYYEILNDILAISYTTNIIILLSIIFNKDLNLINSKKLLFSFLSILFILNTISIILSFTNLKIIKRLKNSLSKFYTMIEYIYTYEIPQFIWDEIGYLDNTSNIIYINLFISIIIICIIIPRLCKNSIENIKIRRKSFLDEFVDD